MSGPAIGTLGFAAVLLLIALRLPVAVAMGVVGALGDFVTDRLSARWRALVRGAGELVTLALMIAVTWYSFAQAGIQIAQGDKSVTLGIPILAYWVPTLAGMLLSCMAVVIVVLRHGRKAFDK